MSSVLPVAALKVSEVVKFGEFPVEVLSRAVEASTESPSQASTATATAAVESNDTCNILDDNDIMGMIECDLPEGSDTQGKVPKYTELEAIENLFKNEANIDRNVKAEAKKGLETYQRVQALSIVRYLQLVGVSKSCRKLLPFDQGREVVLQGTKHPGLDG